MEGRGARERGKERGASPGGLCDPTGSNQGRRGDIQQKREGAPQPPYPLNYFSRKSDPYSPVAPADTGTHPSGGVHYTSRVGPEPTATTTIPFTGPIYMDLMSGNPPKTPWTGDRCFDVVDVPPGRQMSVFPLSRARGGLPH